jgi:outer membrane protein assembly factor BamB
MAEEPPAPAEEAPPANGESAPGHVEDMLPLLPADLVEEAPQETSKWDEPPPVRASSPTAPPADEGADWQSPPPVRRAHLDDLAVPRRPRPSEAAIDLAPRPSRARRWAIRAIVGMIATIFLAGIAFGLIWMFFVRETEEKTVRRADEEYREERFGQAAASYQKLIDKFPDSNNIKLYQLLVELSQLREPIYSSQGDLDDNTAKVDAFLEAHKSDSLLKGYRKDLRLTLLKLAGMQAEEGRKQDAKDNEQLIADARKRLNRAKNLRDEAEKYRDGEDTDDAELARSIKETETRIAGWEKHLNMLTRLRDLMQKNKPSNDIVRQMLEYVKNEKFDEDPDARNLIEQEKVDVRKLVRYVKELIRPQLPPETADASMLVVPRLDDGVNGPGKKGVVLALVRSVLYALDLDNGEVLWSRRVGIDTAALPVRLPRTVIRQELFLVVSADNNSLMALQPLTGHVAWEHRLSRPCLGRPVIVDNLAGDHLIYVPTYGPEGRVYEIEAALGNIVGYFELGQPMTVGGVWQEGTDLLYFPAVNDNVYVLDIARGNPAPRPKGCVSVLDTGHRKLLSEPIIVNRVDPFAKAANEPGFPPFLILSEDEGNQQMKLRAFELPVDRPTDQPRPLLPEMRLRGYSWFPPYHDAERLALVTDAGVFGLYGINQVRNEDTPLFSQFKDEQALVANPAASVGRGQVVHAVENDFWVIANGELQRLHVDLFRQERTPVWPAALPLGSPLHAAQLDESSKTMFVVTEDLNRHIHLATAVDIEDGKIRWQRQIGLECQGAPLVLAQDVLAVDRGGGLFRFAKPERAGQAAASWTNPVVDKPLDVRGAVTSYLLPGGDGETAYQVACTTKGTPQLTVRKYQSSKEGPRLEVRTVALPSPLHGMPALLGEDLLLLLADGTMLRLPLRPDGGPGTAGPDWRSPRADNGAPGFVVPIPRSPDEFLTTDGSLGLTHRVWPKQGNYGTLPPNQVPTVPLPARIVGPPVVLPRAAANPTLEVCVGDATGNLTLLRGGEAGLKTERTWSLGGQITAGPFLRGGAIGCVVDKKRLVWIDPAKPERLWEYTMEGGQIVGQPEVIDGTLVVADLSGRFIGLDPHTGKQRGDGYTLNFGAPVVATPVAFGPGQALVPLTDGTLFLLPLRKLRNAMWSVPTVLP